MQSLQERYSPEGRCFGCGPKNEQGLRIRSFVEGHELVARWVPAAHHLAFEGILNGGVCGALLDCHSNWCAAWTLMERDGAATPPPCVTSDFHVKLKRPTPMDVELLIRAWPVTVTEDRAVIEAVLHANGKDTATCIGTFVAVQPDHPAFHRW